jgi:hypothetical protein
VTELRALSLTPTWCWVVVFLGKRIENRHCAFRYRGPLALHASKKIEDYDDVVQFVGRYFGRMLAEKIPPREKIPCGGFVGRCQLIDVIQQDNQVMARHLAEKHKLDLRWWMGTNGHVLEDVKPLEFFPYRGMQGLWRVPVVVQQQLRLAT